MPTTARISATSYRTAITSGPHELRADIAAPIGEGSAPGPFDLLAAALASCVVMTVRMYAARKQWPLEAAEARVTLDHEEGKPATGGSLALTLLGPLSDDQRARLLEIAARCPVHRTLEAGLHVSITPG